MSDPSSQRLFHHYSEMPYSQRVLFTATLLLLGMGYLFALTNIFLTYAGRAGGSPNMLIYQDIVVGYSGSGKGTVLESALNGPMRNMLPQDERTTILAWLENGASPEAYESKIKPIVVSRCMMCHNGTNPHIPNFSSFDEFKNVIKMDTGPSNARLVLVSHIHLFSIGFIFFIIGLMFSHAYVRPPWLKSAVIAVPFLGIATDISSWYLVKLFHPFAWGVIGGGMIMGACFAFMWVVTMYQLWFYKPSRIVLERFGGDIPNNT